MGLVSLVVSKGAIVVSRVVSSGAIVVPRLVSSGVVVSLVNKPAIVVSLLVSSTVDVSNKDDPGCNLIEKFAGNEVSGDSTDVVVVEPIFGGFSNVAVADSVSRVMLWECNFAVSLSW